MTQLSAATLPVAAVSTMSSTIPLERQEILRHNLAVSLDRPLLPQKGNHWMDTLKFGIEALETLLTSILMSRVFLMTLASLCTALLLKKVVYDANTSTINSNIVSDDANSGSVLSSSDGGDDDLYSMRKTTHQLYQQIRAKVRLYAAKLKQMLLRSVFSLQGGASAAKASEQVPSATADAVPMKFANGQEGWGVCTLLDRRDVPLKSSSSSGDGSAGEYVEYTFALPRAENYIPLALGQQVSMCCLDAEQNVAKGDFYPFSPRFQTGKFSIVVPKCGGDVDKLEASIGADRSNFAQVIQNDLSIGDEIALKPGPTTLEYRGQYLPVTDMLYFVSDTGVVPILEQVKAVLPSGTSSVKNVNVVWVNKKSEQFELAYDQLEEEFFKFNTKLEVGCCLVDDYLYMENNGEIIESVPDFRPGAMAVVAGPTEFVRQAERFLKSRGYPNEVICALP
eukprot:CAMPEP_0196824100 /NCGR_PEP_ID=MMETSP1362-20130617/90414_1 /TAXON_ID=163516 /ORGANISM="Leptocylindrus danicus, Strain CCMP1856" /LENGTH=450 /DNA_ID=CAMNT_0042204235 /DNA_START=138 /DNA_END=1490 /DNA_ORIENTATION=-